jgi:chemotaxis protein histidine kinase CheA
MPGTAGRFTAMGAVPGTRAARGHVPQGAEILNRIFRALRTIKGTSGFLGFDPLVRLSHQAEEILNNLRGGELRLTTRIMHALLELHRKIDALASGP